MELSMGRPEKEKLWAAFSILEEDDAIGTYRNLLKADSDNFVYNGCLGIALKIAGEFEDAMVFLEKARELEPKCAVFNVFLGDIWAEEYKDYGEAVKCYGRAVGLDPEVAKYRFCLAVALKMSGRDEDALFSIRKARDKAQYAGDKGLLKEIEKVLLRFEGDDGSLNMGAGEQPGGCTNSRTCDPG